MTPRRAGFRLEGEGRGASNMTITIFDGVCPDCGAAEGPFTMGQSRWFYCGEHKVKWLGGYDRPIAEHDRDMDAERRQYDVIGLGQFRYLGPDAEGYYATPA
jgi:hypothetical protein